MKISRKREAVWERISREQKIHHCLVCGCDIDDPSKDYCSEECKRINRLRVYEQKKAAERIKKHFHKTPISDEAAVRGLSYADVQKEQTLKKIKEELK